MKIKINSLYDKKFFYRIYATEGDKRTLLTKGSFVGSTEFELPHTGREIIVRIRPKRGIKSIPHLFKVGLLNTFLYENRHLTQYDPYDVYNLFNEIRITDTDLSEQMEINYSTAPIEEMQPNSIYKKVRIEYLTCKTHPYKQEFKKSESASSCFSMLLGIGVIAIIFGIAFLIGFFCKILLK